MTNIYGVRAYFVGVQPMVPGTTTYDHNVCAHGVLDLVYETIIQPYADTCRIFIRQCKLNPFPILRVVTW
jgi:hypothetical protein